MEIEVEIPKQYHDDHVLFVSDILRKTMVTSIESQARVVLDETTGTVVVGADVEIGPVAVTHGNVTVEAGGAFVGVDLSGKERRLEAQRKRLEREDDANELPSGNVRLQALVNALNAICVPSSDIIGIIRKIDECGQLYGKVVLQ